jgi:curved DNA-binding protein CbpA
MRSHYDVLGVAPSTSYADMKRAYQRRLLALHPDKLVIASAADEYAERREEEFRSVRHAWAVLGDGMS